MNDCEVKPRRHWIEGFGAGPGKLTGPRPHSEGVTPLRVALSSCGFFGPAVHGKRNWSGCEEMNLSLMHGVSVNRACRTRLRFRSGGRAIPIERHLA